MAKLIKGKLHGRIGNTVHRVFRGQEIVQSYPQTVKPSGKTLIENKLFGNCSAMNSKIYMLIKDFSLNKLDYDFCWETMALFKRNFFQRNELNNVVSSDNWKKIEAATNLTINKKVLVSDMMEESPVGDLYEDKLLLYMPECKSINNSFLMKGAVSMEYSATVIHYDTELKVAEVVHVVNSGRRYLPKGFSEQMHEFDLLNGEREIRNGLIVLCFGLRFFASSISYGTLNSMEVNPTSILGMWWKG